MSLNQKNRLYEKTNEDVSICDQKIQQWNKFLKDYEALDNRLTTITDRTTHEVMVPIAGSDLAFMPGFIKHTNEILVLLGDNYFVERSAKQAKEIVSRRLQSCHKMIDDLNKEKDNLKKWLEFTQQINEENQEFVEIVEEYDEEKEKKWKEEHKRRLQEYKFKQKSMKQTEDKEINERLSKMEIEEKNEVKSEPKSILKKSVSFAPNVKTFDTFNENKSSVKTTESPNLIEKSDEISDELAFKNEVKERNVDIDWSQVMNTTENKSTKKSVSRFKSNRMN
ncbi:unconventional prefoldin RPB5 interactor-like [Oppia nitens]|uniref:unconventional prefoldin RPB5 interactor-like n=1 Tax=Oppia nitens TaxID=1686743 RepID=UPI0023DABB84|nr:unconventional prefoldin RPB5 interactor-like [Oppia nitens]